MTINVYCPEGVLLAIERTRLLPALAQLYPVGVEFHTHDAVYINEPTRIAWLRSIPAAPNVGDGIIFRAALMLWPLALLL